MAYRLVRMRKKCWSKISLDCPLKFSCINTSFIFWHEPLWKVICENWEKKNAKERWAKRIKVKKNWVFDFHVQYMVKIIPSFCKLHLRLVNHRFLYVFPQHFPLYNSSKIFCIFLPWTSITDLLNFYYQPEPGKLVKTIYSKLNINK